MMWWNNGWGWGGWLGMSLSAFVIGPAINGTDTAPAPATVITTSPAATTGAPTDHSSHHQ